MDLETGDRLIISSNLEGSGPPMTSPHNVEFLSATSVLLTDRTENLLVRLDVNTGVRTVVSGGGVGSGDALNFPFDLVVSPAGTEAIISNLGTQTLLSINLSNGARTTIHTFDQNLAVPTQFPIYIEGLGDGRILESQVSEGLLSLFNPETSTRTFLLAE